MKGRATALITKIRFGFTILTMVVVIMTLCSCTVKQNGVDNSTNSSGLDSATKNTDPNAENTAKNTSEDPSSESTTKNTVEDSNSGSDDNNPEISNTKDSDQIIEDFIKSIKNNDAETLKSIISPSGLIIIRSFSFGNGARGKDIRDVYSADKIPANLSFEVSGEDPIVLNELFVKSQQTEIKDIPRSDVTDNNFNFQDSIKNDTYGPPTDEIIDICGGIPSDTTENSQYAPKVYILGDKEMAITESALVAYTPVGTWAVFEMIDSKLYLRVIIDLR